MQKKEFLNPFTIVFGLVIVLSLIGLFFIWMSVPKNTTQNTPNGQTLEDLLITDVKVPMSKEDDLVRGDANAPILMVEYSDLECPVCKSFHVTAKKVFQDYNGKVAWVFRHYPIDSIHKNAKGLAESVECSFRSEGADFAWSLIDRIYQEMPGVNLDRSVAIAKELGMEEITLTACLDSEQTKQSVENEFREGLSGGVKGTPTIFIFNTLNGRSVGVPFGADEATLKAIIDDIANLDNGTPVPAQTTTEDVPQATPQQ